MDAHRPTSKSKKKSRIYTSNLHLTKLKKKSTKLKISRRKIKIRAEISEIETKKINET